MLWSGLAFQDSSEVLHEKLKGTLHMIWLHWDFNLFHNVMDKKTIYLLKTWPNSLTELLHISKLLWQPEKPVIPNEAIDQYLFST